MRGTKNFVLVIIFIIVAGIIAFYFVVNREPSISKETMPQVIFIEPHQFSVTADLPDSSAIKRAAFVEKIKSVFKSKAVETTPSTEPLLNIE